MQAEAAVTIIGVALVVIAIAVYLLAIIRVLRDIHQRLDVVYGAVARIVGQTEPVGPVVGSINANLTKARNLLEGLLVSKLGDAGAAELVASIQPNGASAAPARISVASSAGPVASSAEPVAAAAVAAAAPSGRLTPRSRDFPGAGAAPAAPAPEEAPSAPSRPAAPGRVDVRSRRPWER